MQIGIALPHQLMAWRGIAGATQVPPEARYQTHGLPEQDRFSEAFFLACALSTSISVSQNKTSAASCGHSRPSKVTNMMRQAITKLIAMVR